MRSGKADRAKSDTGGECPRGIYEHGNAAQGSHAHLSRGPYRSVTSGAVTTGTLRGSRLHTWVNQSHPPRSGTWADPAENARTISWVRTFWHALQPFSSGNIYVNYESDIGVDRVQAAYGAAKYARLVALKNTYDPTNVFRLNANVKPTV
jgi:hypothetical protein